MSFKPKNKALLALSDGTILTGWAIGKIGTTQGELSFNTGMTGYQELITDPANYGQITIMTNPHVGNIGTSTKDDEHSSAMVSGLVVREFDLSSPQPTSQKSLQLYLADNNIVGISGIDTRSLVQHLRKTGPLFAVISSEILDKTTILEKVKKAEYNTLNPIKQVTRKQSTILNGVSQFKVAVMDYGVKQNVINSLHNKGCTVNILPADTNIEEIEKWAPDGIVLSSGPGNPELASNYATQVINYAKTQNIPIFGIGLGHQLLALNEGFKIIKMHVGHRGNNQPVKNLSNGKVEITTQNHGYEICNKSMPENTAKITHINLNNNGIEGLEFYNFNAFSVQYNPEAAPGPHDSVYLFDRFINMMKDTKSINAPL